MKDKCNIWTRVTDPGYLQGSWHTVQGNTDMDPDKAAQQAEVGNKRSVQFGLNLEYQVLPVGIRPTE